MTVADRIAGLRARAAELRSRGDLFGAQWHEDQANREELQERQRVEKLHEAAEIIKEKLVTRGAAEAVQPTTHTTAKTGRTGRPPKESEDVKAAMREMHPTLLAEMTDREMADKFGADKNTCSKARAIVLGWVVKK